MSKLWAFGDSFTEGFDSYKNTHPAGSLIEWREKYIKWKGYIPQSINTILADKLNIETENFGIGGSDNYTIFHTIIQNIEKIGEDDIVLIGWSTVSRFRLANDSDKFESITMWFRSANDNALDRLKVSQQTIDEIFVNRLNKTYVNEINDYIKLLKFSLKTKKIIFWSPFYINIKMGMNITQIPHLESIRDETKGEVDDLHFSEPSNFILADHFYYILQNFGENKKLL